MQYQVQTTVTQTVPGQAVGAPYNMLGSNSNSFPAKRIGMDGTKISDHISLWDIHNMPTRSKFTFFPVFLNF